MGAPEDEHIFGVQLRESANDGSDFTNADADYRKVFLGEDGALHAKDSAGTVTDLGGTIASLDDVGDVNAPSPSNGDVLTWDSTPGEWVNAAPGGGSGALVLLEQHTASSSSSLDFTTFISSTYDTYKIEVVDLACATDNVSLLVEVGSGGGPTYDTGNNYEWCGTGASTAGNPGTDAGMTGIPRLFDNMDNNSGYGFGTATLTATNLQSTTHRKTFLGVTQHVNNSPASFIRVWGMQWTTLATVATALRFIPSSGNIASGTIRIYGVVK